MKDNTITNIKTAIDKWDKFYERLYFCYSALTVEQDIFVKEFPLCFEENTFYDSAFFIEYLKKEIVDITDYETKTNLYSSISTILKTRDEKCKQVERNMQITVEKKMFTESVPQKFFFLLELTKYVNEKGQIDHNNHFISFDFFKKIKRDIEFAKNNVIEIFTLKELHKEQQPSTKRETTQPKIEPIKWKKKSVLLAYLINELKTYGFIDEDSIWAICEQVFVDKKGNPIKAETFTSMVKNYQNNQTPDGKNGKPKEHTEITQLIKTMKAISQGME